MSQPRELAQFIIDAYSRIELADWDMETIADELADMRKQAAELLDAPPEEEHHPNCEIAVAVCTCARERRTDEAFSNLALYKEPDDEC